MESYIKCYIKNKLIYKIHIRMNPERLKEQLDNNKLIYINEDTGNTEIVYLDKFDKLDFDRNIF